MLVFKEEGTPYFVARYKGSEYLGYSSYEAICRALSCIKIKRKISFDIFNYIVAIIIFVLAVDGLGYCLWKLSGQVPIDNFHIGRITEIILGK